MHNAKLAVTIFMTILYDLKMMSNDTSQKFKLNRKEFFCQQNLFPYFLLLEQDIWNLHSLKSKWQ